MFVVAVIYVVSVSSCATQETCWAYRDTTKKYNNNKKRPSIAGAMNKKRAKLVYYR